MSSRAVLARSRVVFAMISALAAAVGVSPAVASPSISHFLWASRYDTGYSANAVAVGPDASRFFVTGEAAGNYGTVAYNAANGAQLWTASYDGGGSASDIAQAMVVNFDGSRVFVTGRSSGPANLDFGTVAYDATTGAQVWASTYNGPANDDDYAAAISVSPDGSKVFVTGTSSGGGAFADYATVAYSASDGTQLWAHRYQGLRTNAATAIVTNPDGATVYVTGYSPRQSGDNDFVTIAYKTATGQQSWLNRWNGTGNTDDLAYSMGISPDGQRLFATGCSGAFPGCLPGNFATLALATGTGTKLWLKRFDGPVHGNDSAKALVVSPDGSKVYVTGLSDGFTSIDYGVVAYDAFSGSVVWLGNFNGVGNAEDIPSGIAVSPNGQEVVVTGQSSLSYDLTDYATITFNSNGARLWSENYDGPAHSNDSANAVAVSVDSLRVFVTGRSVRFTSPSYEYDYATIAYAA